MKLAIFILLVSLAVCKEEAKVRSICDAWTGLTHFILGTGCSSHIHEFCDPLYDIPSELIKAIWNFDFSYIKKAISNLYTGVTLLIAHFQYCEYGNYVKEFIPKALKCVGSMKVNFIDIGKKFISMIFCLISGYYYDAGGYMGEILHMLSTC